MKVLIDTSVWSLALRRLSPKPEIANEVRQLIADNRAVIIGPIRQELLSGMSDDGQFQLLKTKLRAFADIPLTTAHFEFAAELSNKCRLKGVIGSHVDFMICAAAKMERVAIFTTDRDFDHYSKTIGLSLYKFSPAGR